MQYDSPITSTEFQTFLTNASISNDTAAAISTLLNLENADTVNLAWRQCSTDSYRSGRRC